MNFWKRQPSLMVWLLLALLALLPVLAYWQYRWLGEVSDALRERMQRSLKASATQFGQDFDQELTFAYVSLQDPPANLTQMEPFAERYRRWASAAAHPRLVRAVYEATADAQGVFSYQHFNPASGLFEPETAAAASKPEIARDLERLQADFAHTHAARRQAQEVLQNVLGKRLFAEGVAGGEREVRQASIELHHSKSAKTEATGATVIQLSTYDALNEQLPGLVMPLSNFQSGLLDALSANRYRIVLFDQAYLQHELFPLLIQKHLHNLGRDDYHFAVLRTAKSAPEVLYQSDAQLPANLFAMADAAESFFKLRLDARDRFFLRQFGQPPSLVREERKRYSIGVVANEVRVSSQESPPVTAAPLSEPPHRLASASPEGAWQVVIKHRAGSLEAAVTKVRRRNFAISFGVLALLGGSVGLIVLSTRRAQALAVKQMEFVAGISHELRTPLAVICSAAENLADGVVENRDQTKRYGTLIRDEGRRLTSMVEQVLEFAGAQSGKKTYELRPLAPEQVVRDAVTALHLPMEEHGFTLEQKLPPDLPLIQADAAALSRALQNLLSNAMKYSGESRWLGLQASVAKLPNGVELRLAVLDRGLGIPAAELPQIFDPFYRGKEVTAAQIHGNGLGLSLVKHIVEAHGGRVSVESKSGQGSTFTVHLPVVREAAVMTPLLAEMTNDYEQAPAAR
jgi:two-component system sensor histidine kinase SenX3